MATTSHRVSASSGTAAETGRTVVRAGWGLFYDTPAGQGDFFQNGTLAPPFQPLTEVNYSLASADPHFQAPLAGVSSGGTGFPPGLIFIGWGPRFTTPLAHHYHASLQRDVAAIVGVEVALRRLTRAQPSHLHGGQPDGADPRRHAATGFAPPARVQPGASEPGRGAIVVRLAAGERASAAVARSHGAAVVHLGPCHRSRIGPEHRRRGAADAAGLACRSQGGRGVDDRRGAGTREG